jgi:hypothetical protein
MKIGALLALWPCLLIALLGASPQATSDASARASSPTVQTKDTRTYIFVKGRGRYSATCGPTDILVVHHMTCDADWIDPDLDVWAVRLNARTWGVGSESFRIPEHIDTYARRKTPRLWRVGGREGSIRFHSLGRWDVYKHGRMIGYTKGPQGVGTASMWIDWSA